jgi:hypothetical protein
MGFTNPLARWTRPDHGETVDRIRADTRALLGLTDEVTIFVTELACARRDCPDAETIVVAFTDEQTACTLRVAKRMFDVGRDDLSAALEKSRRREEST